MFKKACLLIVFLVFQISVVKAETLECIVTRVVDGDTIEVSCGNKTEIVRLIGVDTPETKHPRKPVEYYGKEASAFTYEMCMYRWVRLKIPKIRRGKYGRLLAYVYVRRYDNSLLDLNAELLKRGFARTYTKFYFDRMSEFKRYEHQARLLKIGIWGKE